MAKNGPIILIEDDVDDKALFEEVLMDLEVRNKLHWFINPIEAYSYLITTNEKPFLIVCDINLPKQNGLDFKMRIDADKYLRQKSIPFVFYSTSASQDTINEAYMQMSVQGYFQKSQTYTTSKQPGRPL